MIIDELIQNLVVFNEFIWNELKSSRKNSKFDDDNSRRLDDL